LNPKKKTQEALEREREREREQNESNRKQGVKPCQNVKFFFWS
jgi:hypothetical protein